WLLGIAEVSFQIDKRSGEEHRLPIRRLVLAPAPGVPVDWARAMDNIPDPVAKPEANARWGPVPESVDTGRKVKAVEKAFTEYLYGSVKLTLWENRDLVLMSKPSETKEAFQKRCRQAAQQRREEEVLLERIKFAPKIKAAEQSTSKGREDRIGR